MQMLDHVIETLKAVNCAEEEWAWTCLHLKIAPGAVVNVSGTLIDCENESGGIDIDKLDKWADEWFDSKRIAAMHLDRIKLSGELHVVVDDRVNMLARLDCGWVQFDRRDFPILWDHECEEYASSDPAITVVELEIPGVNMPPA